MKVLRTLILATLILAPVFTYASTYGSSTYDSGIYSGVLPTVTTGSASSLAQTSASLNGSIVGAGAHSPTTRGFAWGTSTSYGATTTETGTFSTGSFSTSVSGLVCATPYYFRAYAVSTDGTGYRIDATFTTSNCTVVVSSGGLSATLHPHRAQTREPPLLFPFPSPHHKTHRRGYL